MNALLDGLNMLYSEISFIKKPKKLLLKIPYLLNSAFSFNYAAIFAVDPILDEVSVISSSFPGELEKVILSLMHRHPFVDFLSKAETTCSLELEGGYLFLVKVTGCVEKLLISLFRSQPFKEEEEKALVLFADKLKCTLDKFSAQATQKDCYLQVIKTLTRAVDARSPYTRGHSERVAEYSVQIARALGWNEEQIESLKEAALLHDIGKIGIPDNILKKPSRLTREEFEQMKRHSIESARILESASILQDVIPYIMYHHERYDGKGYPFGLKGDDIPLGAQIIAVADALDAITSDRVYRKALPWQVAIEKIRQNSGTQFSPKVVDALLTALEQQGQNPLLLKK